MKENFPLRLHDVMLNSLSTGTTLSSFTFTRDKFTYAIKTYGGGGGLGTIAQVLISILDGCERSASRPDRSTTGSSPVRGGSKLSGPQREVKFNSPAWS
jgi:hypothetical protein